MTGPVKALFTDIGGVLLTNGWDHLARARACERFGLDTEELHERHHLTFDTYEQGKLSLAEYLERTVFYQPRSFDVEEFREFIYSQSQKLPRMLELLAALKERYRLKVVAVSNEGRELTEHRISTFNLGSVIDTFVSSCFVQLRKPDAEIFRLALDIAQVPASNIVYIDDRPMFVDVAAGLGIRGIAHESFEATERALSSLGLSL